VGIALEKTPRVAVLMPVYNGEATIEAATRSVLEQTFSDWSLIVVDDGSTDDSIAQLTSVAGSETRIRVLRQEHLGLVSALNLGLSQVGGAVDYVARMDCDDVMHPVRLDRQVRMLDTHSELTLVSCKVRIEPEDSGLSAYVDWLNGLETPQDIARNLFVESPVCHPTVMCRAAALRHIGGYRDRGWPEDYDLWLRFAEAGALMAQVPQILHTWCDSKSRLTRTDPRYSAANFTRLKAHFLARRWSRGRIWGAGRDGKRLARALEAEGMTIDAFIDIDPRKIGGVRRGTVPVIGPADLHRLHAEAPLPIITAVGIPSARQIIRGELKAMGMAEGTDFVCAA
jgi:glycosyltransferase involved in cell wall biosynthesis